MSNQSVIKFAQELLLNEERNTVSPALINAKIDQVLAFQPAWQNGFDRDAAIAELVRRFSLWVGTDCQSAFKFAPSSASNFDPFARRGLLVALVSSELAGLAEARRARVT